MGVLVASLDRATLVGTPERDAQEAVWREIESALWPS